MLELFPNGNEYGEGKRIVTTLKRLQFRSEESLEEVA
jgi:hypothetical protein